VASFEIHLKKLIELRNKKKMQEFNDNMIRQYRLMSLQGIITINDKDHNVEEWYNQFVVWNRVQGFKQPRNYFDWCLMKVQGEGAKNITAAVKINCLGEQEFPSLEEMKEILLKTYKMKRNPEDIINELKSMKINKNDDIIKFNQKYTELYNKLDDKFKLRLFTSDYLDAIINKVSVWRNIKLETKNKDITIEEAMEAAEFYDKLEVELRIKTQNNNGFSKNKINKNTNFNKNPKFNNNNNINNSNNNHNNYNNYNNLNQSNFNNKQKVSFCKFCHEKGHSISDCAGFAQYKFLKRNDFGANENNTFHNSNRSFYNSNYPMNNSNFNNFNYDTKNYY